MNDYCLRAESRAALDAALHESGVDSLIESAGAVIDHIGPVDADQRHHANLRTQHPLLDAEASLLPIIPPPETPARVWADLTA